jgi:HK97 family phage major capsid protein
VDLEERIKALQESIKTLGEKMQPGIDPDEFTSLKAAVEKDREELLPLLKQQRDAEIERERVAIKANVDELMRRQSRVDDLDDDPVNAGSGTKAFSEGANGVWLKALYEAKKSGDPDAWQRLRQTGLKATVGDSGAAGQYIIPNNFVSSVVTIQTARSIYRRLFDVVNGVRGKAVDIPYELNDSSLQRAIGQGGETLSYGSNKDIRDFTLGSVTASLFTIARIITVGNQFLRQSEGAAEQLVRSKLGRSFALAEAHYLLNGTGNGGQPKGLITSLAAASSSYSTAYSTGVRADKLAEAISALEQRNYFPTAIVTNPADFWQIVTDTLGTSGSGGYAISPQSGATFDPGSPSESLRIWGVPVLRDPNMTAGTAVMGEWNSAQMFVGDEYRIDVSDEAGDFWQRNLTGFRAEMELAFNADPYVLVGMFQRVTGL